MIREETIEKAQMFLARVNAGERNNFVAAELSFGKTPRRLVDEVNNQGGTLRERAIRLCELRNEVYEKARKAAMQPTRPAPEEGHLFLDDEPKPIITYLTDWQALKYQAAAQMFTAFLMDGKTYEQAILFAVNAANTLEEKIKED